jgi:hypothetical protein
MHIKPTKKLQKFIVTARAYDDSSSVKIYPESLATEAAPIIAETDVEF